MYFHLLSTLIRAKEPLTSYKEFPYFTMTEYRNMFFIPVDNASIKSNKGQYGQSVIGNAINYSNTAHYEANQEVSENNPIIINVTFPERVTFSRVLYARRQDTVKGFIHNATFSYQNGTDAQPVIVQSINFQGDTGKVINIPLGESITCTSFIMTVYKVDQKWFSMKYLAFAKEDTLLESMRNIFTDGTWTKIREGVNIEELKELAKSHPLKSNFAKHFEVVDELIKEPGKFDNDVTEIMCDTNSVVEKRTLDTSAQFFHVMPTGYYYIANQTFDAFCENTTTESLHAERVSPAHPFAHMNENLIE